MELWSCLDGCRPQPSQRTEHRTLDFGHLAIESANCSNAPKHFGELAGWSGWFQFIWFQSHFNELQSVDSCQHDLHFFFFYLSLSLYLSIFRFYHLSLRVLNRIHKGVLTDLTVCL